MNWEKQLVKDYKIITLDLQHKMSKPGAFLVDGITKLADLHGQKLVFLTNFHPRARYVWWTFLSAVLRTGWQQKSNKETNAITAEVSKANWYWGPEVAT